MNSISCIYDVFMNGATNPLTTKLFRVRKTVFKMLAKRGYAVSEEDMNMTLDIFLRDVRTWGHTLFLSIVILMEE